MSDAIKELTLSAENYRFKLDFLNLLPGLSILENQPLSLIHGEINVANAQRATNGTMYLLDWDATGNGPAQLMSGYPLIHFIDEYTLEFHSDWASAFYRAYSAGKPMKQDEKEILFQAAILHCLRYLPFHNTDGRWERIRYAIANKELLLSAIP